MHMYRDVKAKTAALMSNDTILMARLRFSRIIHACQSMPIVFYGSKLVPDTLHAM